MKTINYVKFIKYQCQNPECRHGYNIEGHHIKPKKTGGEDAYWNIIALCRKCHRGNNNHSKWKDRQTILYTYKCMYELEHFGFILDERDKDFLSHIASLFDKVSKNESEDKSKDENGLKPYTVQNRPIEEPCHDPEKHAQKLQTQSYHQIVLFAQKDKR